jgi:hypothetical protein
VANAWCLAGTQQQVQQEQKQCMSQPGQLKCAPSEGSGRENHVQARRIASFCSENKKRLDCRGYTRNAVWTLTDLEVRGASK